MPQDPKLIIKQEENDKNQKKTGGVFGGGEDIFDNEDIFKPVDKNQDNLGGNDDNGGLGKITDDEKIEEEEVDFDDELEFNPFETSEDNTNDNGGLKEDNGRLGEITEDKKLENEEIRDEIPAAKLDAGMTKQKDEKVEEIIEDEKVEEEISEDKKMEMEKKVGSDLINKFEQLIEITKKVYEAANMDDDENIEILGGNTEETKTIYNLRLLKDDDEEAILINKIETNNESGEETQYSLQISQTNGSLNIILDEHLLYDESQDLDDENKKMQVIDKLNKFIFLVGEELKTIEENREEKERLDEERKRLRDIFRNF